MYGEFGTFDVTLILATDQVVGATGVPVAGDPGWEKAKVWGEVHLARDAYGAVDATLPEVAAGKKAVRFYARDVHHFGWATDPEFKYEGALYRGAIPIHVLITPAQLAKLGHGVFVMWNEHALEFLEKIYGPYGYPQLTGLIRLDPGATEFPMMAMYGDPSEGTVSHEVGHIYSYGMLANNEWREGWLDEGLTSYQSEWRIRETPQDVAEGAPEQGPPPAAGYRAHAHVMSAEDRSRVQLYDVDLLGRAQAPEPPSGTFNEFNIYQMAVYSRPDLMYGMLRDMLGDSVFTAFLHDYYARWKFKHVDELAMRASAERVSGRKLDWFFEQWVHHTGLVDYALEDVETARDGDGWLTRAKIIRRGEYRHAMPVGVTSQDVGGSWTIVRGDPMLDEQWVEIRSAAKPMHVQLDPLHSNGRLGSSQQRVGRAPRWARDDVRSRLALSRADGSQPPARGDRTRGVVHGARRLHGRGSPSLELRGGWRRGVGQARARRRAVVADSRWGKRGRACDGMAHVLESDGAVSRSTTGWCERRCVGARWHHEGGDQEGLEP